MIPEYLFPLANHLWQSTVFVGIASLLALAFRKNHARVRFWVWLAASLKFLVPFSLLAAIGGQLAEPSSAIAESPLIYAMDEISYPFSYSGIELENAMGSTSMGAQWLAWPGILLAVWFCGVAVVSLSWLREWLRMRAVVKSAAHMNLNIPIKTLSSPMPLEPGVVGVFRPVLLLPAGITDKLSPAQLRTIVAHELCHVRRRDNLTAFLHMVVETLFWFHPFVWWIENRLIEERERACDEEVLHATGESQAYAEGILTVCKFYRESSLACRAGVTGSDLKRRIEAIMTPRALAKLGPAQAVLLAGVVVLSFATPIVLGLANAAPVAEQTVDARPTEIAQVAANLEPLAPPATPAATPTPQQATPRLSGRILQVNGQLVPAAVPQEGTATLRGRVFDANGGAVPGALIALTQRRPDGRFNGRAGPADDIGMFEFAGLVPGDYTIQAGMTGFLRASPGSFILQPNEVRSQEFTLVPGLQADLMVDEETTTENRMTIGFGRGQPTRPQEIRKTRGTLVYPRGSLNARQEASVIVEGVLGADGKVIVRRIVSFAPTPPTEDRQIQLDFVQAATQALSQVTFVSATSEPIPPDFPAVIEVEFKSRDQDGAL